MSSCTQSACLLSCRSFDMHLLGTWHPHRHLFVLYTFVVQEGVFFYCVVQICTLEILGDRSKTDILQEKHST
jgi:hypothetical protein